MGVVNAFENASGVTLDVGAYDLNPFSRTGAMDVGMLKNKTQRDANKVKAVIRRVHLHLSGSQAGQATYVDFRKIPESHSDFYKTNPNHIGHLSSLRSPGGLVDIFLFHLSCSARINWVLH